LVNGKYYVGSAVTGNLYMRFLRRGWFYFLRNKTANRHLFAYTGSVLVANAVKKYGLNEFVFLVLEIVPQEEESNNTKK
jgi:hypothetical protein